VLGSFSGLDIGQRGVIRGLPQSLRANVRMIPRLGQGRFLPDPFKIIIHLLSIHSTLYSLDAESAVK
jgi:hypothetical protein